VNQAALVKLRCILCQHRPELAVRADIPIAQALAQTKCPRCQRNGCLQLVRPLPAPPPPDPMGRFDEPPDMEGDEYLRARQKGYALR
jgi:hypothetical protein